MSFARAPAYLPHRRRSRIRVRTYRGFFVRAAILESRHTADRVVDFSCILAEDRARGRSAVGSRPAWVACSVVHVCESTRARVTIHARVGTYCVSHASA